MTDTTPGAWDGRPQDPERDGTHWLNLAGNVIAAQWWTAEALWTWGDRQWTPSVASAARWFYLGPCHTPAEVAALVEAARRRSARCRMSLHSIPDATKLLLIICAVSVPLGLWKMIEIVLWMATHIRWVPHDPR
jgi:hypothetical protein